MLFMDFLQWWYGAGWLLRVRLIGTHILKWVDYFSITTLLRTMFSPWRQNVSKTRADQDLNAKFSALVDNIISRVVGFWVRLFALFAAIIVITIVFIINFLIFLIWPLLPLSPAIAIAVGVVL